MRCSQTYIVFVVVRGIESDSVSFFFHIPCAKIRCRPSHDVPPLEARISFSLKKRKLQYELHKHKESRPHSMNAQRIYSASIDHSSSADLRNAERTVQENLCTFTDSRRTTFCVLFFHSIVLCGCPFNLNCAPRTCTRISHFGNNTKTTELNAAKDDGRFYLLVIFQFRFFWCFCRFLSFTLWVCEVFLFSYFTALGRVANHMKFSMKIQLHSQYFNMHCIQQHFSTQFAANQTGI